MNDVFGNDELPQGESEVAAEPQQVEQPQTEAAPPAADTEKHVPLAALEAERSGRRDWKEKALRLEGELKAAREQAQRSQQPQEQREYDPLQEAVAAAQNERLNTSEMLAREKFGSETVDKAFTEFQQAALQDPSLFRRLKDQPHPWGFIVKEMQKAALLKEVGEDPAAYRERIRAELQAELSSSNPSPRAPLPQSLANARSTGARGTTWTGPPPLDEVFK